MVGADLHRRGRQTMIMVLLGGGRNNATARIAAVGFMMIIVPFLQIGWLASAGAGSVAVLTTGYSLSASEGMVNRS